MNQTGTKLLLGLQAYLVYYWMELAGIALDYQALSGPFLVL